MALTHLRLSGLFHWQVPAGLTMWGLGLAGTLQIQNLPISSDHSICGPWGCGPPLEALIAYHGFWVVLLGGPATVVSAKLPSVPLLRLGRLFLSCGVLVLLGIAAWEAFVWWPGASEWQRPYWIRKYFFTLGTLIDVPVIPVLLVGLLFASVAKLRRNVLTATKTQP